jgi:hypothetical protein
VIDETPLPAGWRALAVPSDWDLGEAELRIRPVTIDYVTYPDDFFMIIQTPEMMTKDEPTAIFVDFKASNAEGIKLVKVHGMGDWVAYLGEVVQKFPPTEWTKRAKIVIVQFVQMPEIRAALAAAGFPQPETESTVGRRGGEDLQRGAKPRRTADPGSTAALRGVPLDGCKVGRRSSARRAAAARRMTEPGHPCAEPPGPRSHRNTTAS